VKWDKAPCRFCGTGCHVQVGVKDGRVVAIAGDQKAEVNKGLLCVKGYHVGLALYGKDRLTRPLLRKNGQLVPITWEQALDVIADRIVADPAGFAMYGSGQWTIPEGYAAQKLVKAGLATNQIDPNARLCMASAVTGFLSTYGVDEPAGCYDDLDRADVVRVLMARGADWKAASSIADLKALTSIVDDGTGRPQQQAPAAAGRLDVAGVTRGYRYNELIGTQGGLTALHFAVRQGSMGAARALVDGGVDVNLVSPGDQASPLLVALINGHFDLAAFLLEKGANPNLLSDAGVSPLYAVLNVQWAPIAAYPQPRAYLQQSRGYLDMVKLLLDKGADPNARVRRKVWYSGYNFDQSGVDEAGASAFWRAAYAADVAAMKMLVSYGADPSLPTTKLFSRRGPEDPAAGTDKSGLPPIVIGGPGATPLHAAAGPGYATGFAGNSHHVAPSGMLPAVKYLVEELGADVNAVDADGNTAVHHAASRGDNEMITFLVAKGADVKKINRNGQTTIDVANGPVQRTQPYPETIKLLESLGAINNHKCLTC